MVAGLGVTTPALAASLLLDGTFLQPIGTGGNRTPWADWTSAGVSQHTAPGIPGNYVSVPVNGDLYQQFSGPAPGQYVLSFLVQNETAWASELVVSVQRPGGLNWTEMVGILDLAPSSDFERITYQFTVDKAEGTPSEFYFSNSYDAVDVIPGLENSKNRAGTIINVADVSITPYSDPPTSAVPEPSSWLMLTMGLGTAGSLLRRSRRGTTPFRTV